MPGNALGAAKARDARAKKAQERIRLARREREQREAEDKRAAGEQESAASPTDGPTTVGLTVHASDSNRSIPLSGQKVAAAMMDAAAPEAAATTIALLRDRRAGPAIRLSAARDILSGPFITKHQQAILDKIGGPDPRAIAAAHDAIMEALAIAERRASLPAGTVVVENEPSTR